MKSISIFVFYLVKGVLIKNKQIVCFLF